MEVKIIIHTKFYLLYYVYYNYRHDKIVECHYNFTTNTAYLNVFKKTSYISTKYISKTYKPKLRRVI